MVGGGFAGLNTALGLVERGLRDVVLLDSQRIGFGASGRNGGFVFGGFSRGEEQLLADLGPERARALYRGTTDAVELIRHRTDRYDIECDRVDAGVVWANWFRDPEVLRQRQRLLAERFDAHWEWVPQAAMRDLVRSQRYHDGLFEPQAFHFHPLKYARGLAVAAMAQGVAIHEGTPAIALERDGRGWRVRTPDGAIEAEHVVLACGGYLAGLRAQVDAGVLPIATYVMVTQPLGARLDEVMSTRAAVYDTRFAFDYYRPLPDTRLLWGGRISVLDRSPDEVEAASPWRHAQGLSATCRRAYRPCLVRVDELCAAPDAADRRHRRWPVAGAGLWGPWRGTDHVRGRTAGRRHRRRRPALARTSRLWTACRR